MKRFLWLGFVLLLHLICTGCGDTFRPIIIPNPPTFPNPAAAHSVVAISDNGTTVAGSVMVIDVSGDSIASVADCTTPLCIGIAPVHAVQQTAGQALVVNQAVTGLAPPPSGCLVTVDDQVFNVCPSITKVNFSSITSINSTTTITLPVSSAPNFVAVAPNQTTAYVTLPNYVPDPITNTVVPSVGVVNTTSNSMSATIPVVYTPPGNTPVLSNPYALAVTPDNTKLYVANKGTLCGSSSPPTPCSFSVSAFNTVGPSARPITGSLSSPPVWLSARSDSQMVYVLEEDGTLAYINILSSAGPDTLTETTNPLIQVPDATTMTYDPNSNRLYIPGGSQIAIVDVSQSPPQYLAGGPITITPVSPLTRAQGDLCSTFTPSAITAVVAAAALPDRSRAYVGSYARFPVDVTISDAKLNSDGIHTTYTYILQSDPAQDLLPGMVITISGVTSKLTNPSAFNGTFAILSVGGGTFEVANAPRPTDTYTGGGSGVAPKICPQVTVINATTNTIETPQITIPGVPGYEPFCATTRFRFMMAAGGDSSRAYLSSCDGGNVNIIDTSNDTYNGSLTAPPGSRYSNPPQNPVFLFAGP